jgi:PAS domain S-box-containing protein
MPDLFPIAGLMPHGCCLSWNPNLLALFVAGNLTVALAYFSIPLALATFATKRSDLSFKWMFSLFATFIVACGLTHLMKIWTLWNPDYWLEGSLDAFTGLISALTAFLLWKLLPKALVEPGPNTQLFRSMFDLMPGLAWTASADGYIDFYNKGWYDYTGRTPEAMLGWGLKEVFPNVFERWKQSIESGQPFEMEYQLLGADQSSKWFLSRVNPMHDSQGKITRWVAIGTDIDASKRFADELQEKVSERTKELVLVNSELMVSQQKFLAIFDHSFQATGLLDANGILLAANQTGLKYLGITADRVIGKPFWETDWWAHSPLLQARLKAGVESAAKGQFVLDFSLKPIFDDAGKVVLIIPEARDITERKRHEEEREELTVKIARSNKDLQQFAYVASHDLQEPLRTVSSFCDLLKQDSSGKLSTSSEKYLEAILVGAARMQQLVKDLLLYSRLEHQGKPLVPIDSTLALKQATYALQTAIDESGVQVTHDPLPAVKGDVVQLSLLFQNLIFNAIKFHSDKPPTIHVSAQRKDGFWQFAVSDNGIGIDPKYAERIFVIFKQLHPRSKYSGTGIGLAVCKRIVERHGGEITVESKIGQGATFLFTIPSAESLMTAEQTPMPTFEEDKSS